MAGTQEDVILLLVFSKVYKQRYTGSRVAWRGYSCENFSKGGRSQYRLERRNTHIYKGSVKY